VKESLKKIVDSPWLKGGLAVLILALLVAFGRFDLSSLQNAMRSWPWLVGAFLLMLPPYAIVSIRFKLVLEAFDLPVSFRDATRWTMIGSFFDIAMPGSSGGDLVKIGYVVSHYGKGNRTKSVMAIFVDRVVGLLGLFILAFIACALGWSTVARLNNARFLILLLCGVCLGSILIFMFLTWPKFANSTRVSRFISALPFGDKLVNAYKAFAALRERKLYLLYIVLLSLANHVFWCSSLFLIVKAAGVTMPLAQGFVVFPLAIFLNTFGFAGGFGVGTVAFDFLFASLLTASCGTTVGLMYQCLSFVSRLSGLPFFLFSKTAKNIVIIESDPI
jgi:glycosyltransferase 2 family protein